MPRKITHRKIVKHSKKHRHKRTPKKYPGASVGTLKSNNTPAIFNVDDIMKPRYHSTITQPSGSLAS